MAAEVDARYPGVELRGVDEQHRVVERLGMVVPTIEQLRVAEALTVAELAAVDEPVGDRADVRVHAPLLAQRHAVRRPARLVVE